MNNNGLINYKENFITKLRNFFKRIFSKKQYDNLQKTSKEIVNEFIKDGKKDEFVTELKVEDIDEDNVLKKEAFLQEIEGNVEKLNMLSIDRLKQLEKYYDNIIAENDKKIKKLKAIT